VTDSRQARLEALLRRLGVYRPVHRAFYFVRSAGLRLFRPTASVSVAGVSAEFGTPTPTHDRWIRNLLGEEALLARYLSALRPGDVVWDVGAHVGMYAVLGAARVGPTGQIVAFEPEPRTFAELRQNVARNDADNVTALPMALGKEDGEATLYTDWRAGLGVHKLFYESRLRPAGTRITVRAGDALRRQGGAPQPSVVKLDVEGWEAEALQGMRDTLAAPQCRLLILEVHTTNLAKLNVPVETVRSLVTAAGFATIDEARRETHYETGERAEQAHWFCTKDVL
jgi:FkbM family methyltransferase